MKYLKFDYASLIKDYPQNLKTIDAITIQLNEVEKKIKNPFGEVQGDLEMQKTTLENRLNEYKQYVALVNLGLDALTEPQHIIIEQACIEGRSNSDIMKQLAVSKTDFYELKKAAWNNFCQVIYPN